MASYGLDYAGARPGGAAIKAAGYDFVVRYLTPGGPNLPGKLLTKSEYTDLQAHGVAVAVNFETTANRMLDGYAAGVNDARIADQTLHAVGHPADLPVYFSADFDATPDQQVAIDSYLNGAADVIGAARVGIYGGYWIVKRCLDKKTAAWAWQTEAWSGGNRDPRTHILQHAEYVVVGGVECDLNEALQSDFGQHPRPAGDEMSAEIAQMVREMHVKVTGLIPTRAVDNTGRPDSEIYKDDMLGWSVNADAFGWKNEQRLIAMQSEVTALRGAINALAAAVSMEHDLSPDEFKIILDDALASAIIKVDVSVTGQPKP